METNERKYNIKKAFAKYVNFENSSEYCYVYTEDYPDFIKTIMPSLSKWEKDYGYNATIYDYYISFKWTDFIKDIFDLGEFIAFMTWAQNIRHKEELDPNNFDPKEFIKQLKKLKDTESIYNLLETNHLCFSRYDIGDLFRAILPTDKKLSNDKLRICVNSKNYPHIIHTNTEKEAIYLIIDWYLESGK